MDPQSLPLKPIHTGGDISWWPLAPGWWILAMLLIGLMVFSWFAIRQQKRKNKPKKIALQRLKQINVNYRQHQDDAQFVDEHGHLIKQFLLAYYPRTTVAKLHGAQLRDFLAAHICNDEHLKNQLLGGLGELLTEGRFKQQVTAPPELTHVVASWIRQFPTSEKQQQAMDLPHARV